MPGIFICYRRSDAEGWAGRLSDSFKAELGRVNIFRDIEDIPPGVEFDTYISEAVGCCDALIALIGPTWLTVKDKNGARRIDDPEDFTRLEIVTALKRNVRVIPALVGGALTPDIHDLPDELKPLARRQSYELSDTRWVDDCRRLANVLRPIIKHKRWTGARVAAVTSLSVAILLTLVVGGKLWRDYQQEEVAAHKTKSDTDTRQVLQLAETQQAEEERLRNATLATQDARADTSQLAGVTAGKQVADVATEIAMREAEPPANDEAVRLAKLAAEENAKQKAAEQKAREEAERLAKREAEQKAKEEEALRAELAAEQRAIEEQNARDEAARRDRLASERKAQEAAAARARLDAERKAKLEADLRARREAEQQARAEQARRERLQAEQKAKEEEARQARLAAEQKAKDEAQRKSEEEALQLAKLESGLGAKNLRKTYFTFPGDGAQNNNSSIGPFCCTGETAAVYNENGDRIGYIYFMDFKGGFRLSSYSSGATEMGILVSGLANLTDTQSPQEQSAIWFSANELSRGRTRSTRAGGLRFKATILQADHGKKVDTSIYYVKESVKVKVDVSVVD